MTTFGLGTSGEHPRIHGTGSQFTHDGGGNLTAVTAPDTSTTTFGYDPQHRLVKKTDARNQITQYAYDFTGRLAQATLPDGANPRGHRLVNGRRCRISRQDKGRQPVRRR